MDSVDKSIVYAIESAVIKWTHQVQVVLKRESSQSFSQLENPTPKVELEFWKKRWVGRYMAEFWGDDALQRIKPELSLGS